MLTDNEKKTLLKRFPDVELSYENVLHKKVFANLFMIIPKGQKVFLWITYYKNKNIAFLLILNHRGNITNIEQCSMCFDSCLAYGTIMYGTLFKNVDIKHFCCEELHMYKGKKVNCLELCKNFDLLRNMFKNHIKQKAYNKSFVIPGIPACYPNKPAAEIIIPTLPYSTYGIKLFNLKNETELGIQLVKEQYITEAIFKVTATVRDDIYNLFCFDHYNPTIPYGLAMIPTYKRSVMMNNLFRTIKENGNLDLLEESDDEEEFENINEDKYVNLNKTLIMKCVYSPRFRKWEPISIIKDKVKITTKKEAQQLEKKV